MTESGFVHRESVYHLDGPLFFGANCGHLAVLTNFVMQLVDLSLVISSQRQDQLVHSRYDCNTEYDCTLSVSPEYIELHRS